MVIDLTHKDFIRSRNGLICKETRIADTPTGYCFRHARISNPKSNKPTDHCKLRLSLYDGPNFLTRVTVRPWEDYVDEVLEANNECATLVGIIRLGNESQRTNHPGFRSHFYYWWYDFETQEDFIAELIQDPLIVNPILETNPLPDDEDDEDENE